MSIFKAKDYLNRQDLEKAVSSEVGADIKANKEAGHTIEGTRAKLAELHLDDTCTIYGCKTVITDTPTKDILAEKVKDKIKYGSVARQSIPQKGRRRRVANLPPRG